MKLNSKQTMLLAGCILSMAVVLLEGCVESTRHNLDNLCGNWKSVGSKPDVLIYKEGEQYKLTLFKRSGVTRKVKPESYLIIHEGENLFINTGFRIDMAYNEAIDVLTFSPYGDYTRANTNDRTKEK